VVNGPEGAGATNDIRAWGTVDVQAGWTGDIVAGGAISTSGGSTGSLNPNQSVKKFQITARNFSCGGTGTTDILSGTPQSISPGTYQRLHVQDGAELTFSSPGDYYIDRLEVSGTGRLILPNAGNVNIHVCEDLNLRGDGWPTTVGPTMRLNSGAAPSQSDAARFRFFVNGTAGSEIADYAEFWGMFFFAHSGVYMGGRSDTHGLVHAEGSVWTNWHGMVDGASITGATCLAAQVTDGTERAESECDYAMVGAGSMTVIGGTVRGGDVKGGGAMTLNPLTTGCEPPAAGLCSYSPSIEQSVYTAGAFAGCASVGGTCNSNLGVGMSVPSIATRAFTCPTGQPALSLTTGDSFAPGTYGAVTVAAGETLQLERGTYTVESLTVGDGATIALPASGTVELDSCGRVHIGSGVSTTGVSSSADALRFQIYSASSDHTPLPGTRTDNAIYVGKGATLYATLTAPTGAALIDEWADVFGFIHASEGIVLNGSILDATGVTGNNCAYNPQFGTCEAVNIENTSTSISDSGVCVENGTDFVDASCSGVDLAADFGCSEYVPVCNHGTVDAPAGVELTFFPRAGHQFAETSPDPAWTLGTCTVTEPIPSGTCVSQACDPSLTSADATVIVNLDEAVTECSLLDNWSLKDSTEICPTTPGTASVVEVTETYEAVCPAETRPSWGFLTWNSQTPGTSSISIEARHASSETGLASEPFVALTSIAHAPIDNQICPHLGGPTGCPVDTSAYLPNASDDFANVTNAMTGNLETVSFLELHFTLNPSGADSPVLRDWEIRYSCAYDQ
jgi:hypothetical protein